MDPSDVVTDLLHADTQIDADGRVDLTAATVETIAEPGRIDFGGGELVAAETVPHERHYRNEGDEYAWWTLREGQYLLSFNESLADDATVSLQPRDELLARGATVPSIRTDALDPLPLSVGGGGLHLKENARVATVVDVVG